MTKAALQAILTQYGDKVKIIEGTGFHIHLNHAKVANSKTTNDITFKTFGSEDFISYSDYDGVSAKDREVLVPVSDVIKVVTVDSPVYDPYRV